MDKRLAAVNRAARAGAGRIAVWLTDDGSSWHRWVNYGTPAAAPTVACGLELGELVDAKTDRSLPRGAERHEGCR